MSKQSQHQPPPRKAWNIYQENESLPIIMYCDSLRLRDNGYTLVKDGVEIPQRNRAYKIIRRYDLD